MNEWQFHAFAILFAWGSWKRETDSSILCIKCVWMNKWMNEGRKEWMNEWMKEGRNEWMNERMNEWMNEWINQLGFQSTERI